MDYDGKVLNAWGPWTDVETITPDVKRAVTEALNAHGPPRPDLGPEEQGHEPYMESGEFVNDNPRAHSAAGTERMKQQKRDFVHHDDL